MDSIICLKTKSHKILVEIYDESMLKIYSLAFNFIGNNQSIMSTLSNTRNYTSVVAGRIALGY